ncbi:sorbosone dehydrogenase family protein [Frigidibacter sp. MR17.14]|uniref:PQQ-dependent sugar dehydrogenase n=1 Tax=Frigidibacter sp. MR17.14 TaxID=3126509 RepID=UPI003012FD76
MGSTARFLLAGACAICLVSSCGGPPRSVARSETGAHPALPAPERSVLPTLNVAPARGWGEGRTPRAARGLAVRAFATGLDHPRWLHVLPNGDVLVAESNKQPSPPKSLRELVQRQVMRVAGAEVKSADRISLLRDADGDGVADLRTVFLEGLTSPFGMALVGDRLYVAQTDALTVFPYRSGQTQIREPGRRVRALPANGANHHWTKGLVAAPDGTLYVSVGSNSDHGEAGERAETSRAAIWRVDPARDRAEVFADGIRNPVGMAIEPGTGRLWAVANERDELGDRLVPDYLTSVHRGQSFGWPWIYYGTDRDPRVDWISAPPEPVSRPDYALGSHVAPLGLAFAKGAALGPDWGEGAFIGEHGSWNRRPASGYAVVFVPFRNGRPSGPPRQVLDGFRTDAGMARGRPAGVAIASDGALPVADDVGNAVWRVTRAVNPREAHSAQVGSVRDGG